MHVVQVDVVNTKPVEALLQGLLAVLRGRVNITWTETLDGKLGGKEDVLAALGVQLEPFADEVLVVAVAVRRVPVDAANLPGAVEDFETIFVGTRR